MARRTLSTDPRALRLRATVKAAAFALVQEKPVESFSLNDLLERSGVSRQGFYEHFDSRDDAVLHAVVDDFADAVAGFEASHSDAQSLLRALTHSVDGRRRIYRHIRAAAIFDQVVDQWRTLIEPTVRRLAETANPQGSKDTAAMDATVAFTIGGIIEMLRLWLRSPEPVSAAREADLLWMTAHNALRR